MKNRKGKIFGTRVLSSLLVIALGIVIYMLLDNFVEVRSWLRQVINILKPFVSALGIAYLLNMPMRFFEKRLFPNLKARRPLSILLSYILALILLGLLLWLVLPQLVNSISMVVVSLSFYLSNLDETMANIANFFGFNPAALQFILDAIEEGIQTMVDGMRDILPQVANFAVSIGSSILNTITAIIASIYLLAGKEKLLRQGKKILYAFFPKKAANEVMRVSTLANNVFSSFIGGKLLDSFIIAIICFVFMFILVVMKLITLPIATLISVIIGVTNVIPFFGPFLGAIPSILVLLTIRPVTALVFLIFIIILQQFDGNILGPKILGDTTGLPAFWVLLSIIVGSGLFGFAGMLLSVPTAAVLYSVIGDIVSRKLVQKNIDIDQPESLETEENPPDDAEWDEESKEVVVEITAVAKQSKLPDASDDESEPPTSSI